MLRKLIAYDMKCLWKSNLLLAAISVVCAAGMGVLTYVDGPEGESVAAGFSMMGLGLLLMITAIGAFVGPVAIGISAVTHYVRKTTSDEAYLTFTLPATAGQQLTAKLISGGIWICVAGALLLFNSFLMELIAVIAISGLSSVKMLFRVILAEFYRELGSNAALLIANLFLALLQVLAGIFSQLALIYFCITLGNNLSPKHKIWAGIGVYIGADLLISFVTGILSAFIAGLLENASLGIASLVSNLAGTLICIAIGFTCYLLNRSTLQSKLNIE